MIRGDHHPFYQSCLHGLRKPLSGDINWGIFTIVLWALQNILLNFVYCRNCNSYENFKLKLCTYARGHALGTFTKFQLEILNIKIISGIVYLRKIICVKKCVKTSQATNHYLYQLNLYFTYMYIRHVAVIIWRIEVIGLFHWWYSYHNSNLRSDHSWVWILARILLLWL